MQPAALEIPPAQSARRDPDRVLARARHGRRALHSRRRRKRPRSKPVCRPSNTFLVEVDASLGGFDQNAGAQISTAALRRKIRGPARRGTREHLGHGSVRDQHRATRASNAPGFDPAPDAKPATAAEGLTFTPFWNSVGADYSRPWDCRCCAAAPSPKRKRRSRADPPWPSSMKCWRKNCGRRAMRSGNASSFRFSKMLRRETARASGGEIKRGEPIEIIGIVPARRNGLFEKEPAGALYLPFARGFQNDVFFFVQFRFALGGR